jgi:Na+-transporting NADH:ubiquinone oxidoreductase subunit B
LIGAGILLYTGIGSWRIMASVYRVDFDGCDLNLFGLNTLMQIAIPSFSTREGLPWRNFMATDPVSATQTNTGKYIYGFCNLLKYLTRLPRRNDVKILL